MSSVWAEASGKPLRQCREVSHWLWPLSGPGLALPASLLQLSTSSTACSLCPGLGGYFLEKV